MVVARGRMRLDGTIYYLSIYLPTYLPACLPACQRITNYHCYFMNADISLH